MKIQRNFLTVSAIVLSSLVIEAISILISLGVAGAGHGSYFPAKIFFPFTMLSTFIFQIIKPPFIILAVIQYPIYGAILVWAYFRNYMKPTTISLLAFHIVAVILCISMRSEFFPSFP